MLGAGKPLLPDLPVQGRKEKCKIDAGDALIAEGGTVVEIEDKAPWVAACQDTIKKNTSDQAELYQQLLDLQ